MPRISIIIPTLQEERAIGETLERLKPFTALPHEVIVADSGSTDRTVELAEKHGARVVRYDDHPKNASRGRNLGASAAQGELFAFIDADVTVVEVNTFFAEAAAAFDADPKLLAIGARVRTLPQVETWGDWLSHRIINTLTSFSNNVMHAGAISGEFQMVRGSAFRAIGGYNERLHIDEDNDLYARLSKIGKTRILRRLWVMHPSRRAHAIGWPRLWLEWTFNWVWVKLLGRPWQSQWAHIR